MKIRSNQSIIELSTPKHHQIFPKESSPALRKSTRIQGALTENHKSLRAGTNPAICWNEPEPYRSKTDSCVFSRMLKCRFASRHHTVGGPPPPAPSRRFHLPSAIFCTQWLNKTLTSGMTSIAEETIVIAIEDEEDLREDWRASAAS